MTPKNTSVTIKLQELEGLRVVGDGLFSDCIHVHLVRTGEGMKWQLAKCQMAGQNGNWRAKKYLND